MSADDESNTTLAGADAGAGSSADGSLLMRAVDVTDDGKYVCSLSNSLGSTETTLELQVLG
jgi:Immunoglobulin I-set domain